MKLKRYWPIIIILLVVFLILTTFITKYFIEQKKASKKSIVKNEKINNYPLSQKENQPKATAYFTYNIEKIDKDTYLLSIFLNGDNNPLVDGVELSLSYNKDLVKIENVIPGESLPYLPRQQISDNKIILSAISQIKNNKIIYASLNSVLAKIKFTYSNSNKPFPEKIFFIGEETGVYYSGKNIFDIEKSFKQIFL